MKKNIIANILGRFWSILSNFLFIPLYIKYLGFDSYSVISFTLIIAGIMAVLDGGLTATLSREFSRKDTSEAEKTNVFNTLETCYLILVFLCIAIIFLSSSLVANHLVTESSFSPHQISYFIKIISFEIGFQLMFRFYSGGLLGLEKQVEANLYQIAWGIVRNALIIIPLFFYPILDVFFIWQAASTLVFTILIKFAIQKKLKRTIGLFSFKIDKAVINKIGGFAGGMMLIAAVAALNTQLDKLTISKLLSLDNLGYYTLSVSLSQGLIILVNPITTALLPRLTAHYSFGEKEEAAKIFKLSSLLISVILFSIMLTMAFFAEDLVWIWTGDRNIAEKTHLLVPVVLFSYCMIALQMLPYHIAIANGNTRINNILGILSLIVTIPGYLFFTKKYGAIGAAGVFCTVQTLTTFIYFYFINLSFLNLAFFKDIVLKRFLFPLILASIVVFLFSLIPNIFQNSRILDLMWVGVCLMVTLGITLPFFLPLKKLQALYPKAIE